MSIPRAAARRRAAGATVVAGIVGALLVPVGLVLAAAPAVAAQGECPPGYLPGPHVPDGDDIFTDDNVAVYAGGDFLADAAAAESEGLLVVMGDATFDKDAGGRFNVGWVGVGSQVAPTPGSVMLAVGNALTVGPTTVLDVGSGAIDADTGDLLGGGVQVGATATPGFPAPQYELNNGTFQVDMGADAVSQWATFGDSLVSNSTAWAALPDTNPAAVAGPSLTMVGDGTTALQVFSVSAATLNSITEVHFTGIADGASVVINVTGPGPVTFSPNYFSDDGVRADDLTSTLFGQVAQRTMWNFVDATSVTFGGSSQFLGSVMAPNGSYDITASMNGRVYAGGDIHMHGVGNELHNYPWNGDEYDCIPIPMPDATGSVEITKVLQTTGVVEPDREFYGWMQCTGEGVDGDFYAEGSIHAGETLTVDGLPIGSECQVFEDATRARAGQDPLPPDFIWAEPVWTINGQVVDEPVFTVPGPEDPVQIAITLANTLLARFAVTKTVDGTDGTYIGDRGFEIEYSCDAEAFDDAGAPLGEGSDAGTFLIADGGTAISAWYPVGTTCEVTEATPAAQDGDFADEGTTWNTPTITPSSITVADGDDPLVTVTVANTFTGPTPMPTPTPTPVPTVTPTPPAPLPATGGSIPWWALAVGGALLLGGAAVVVVSVVRRRNG